MRILIKGTNWIGDAVMSIPAIKKIRTAFPEAFIALHTRKWAEAVFADSGLFDTVISFEPGGSRMRKVTEQSRELRRYSFDAAVLLPNSFESALTVALAGIPRRFGYRADGRRILLTDSFPVPEWKSERHESEFYLNLAEAMVVAMGVTEFVNLPTDSLLSASEERKHVAKELLETYGVELGRSLVAVGAGSTNSMAKRWPVEYFAELCDSIFDEFGSEIVLLGSPNESGVGEALSNLSKARIHDLTGKTDLSSAMAILSIADLFVSNDMGLAHLAAGLGAPTLTLFGPTNEVATAPLGPNARFVREVVECAPCMLRACPIDHRCMRRLEPSRVFNVVTEMLENRVRK